MRRVQLEAHAKINWALEVLGKRADGYHEIATLLQGVNLFDRIILEETEGEITVTATDPSVPSGPGNLAWRAAKLIQERRGITQGVQIAVEKRIPTAAGLGGGSSDAAAVLLGLERLWGTGASREELNAWATCLGMDVPFFLNGGRALAEGRGEELTPLPPGPTYHLVAVNPNFPLPTQDVYGWVEAPAPRRGHSLAPLEKALREGRRVDVAALIHNDLEALVASRHPEVAEIRTALFDAGAGGVVMSGSGPTMLALADSRAHAAKVARAVTGRGWSVWSLSTITGPAVRLRRLPAQRPGPS